jgi:WD40 repeat protein/serine/threonine protein kinase
MNDFHIERHGFDAPTDEVDAICDAFEAAWLGGHEPGIEDFLLRGDASHQGQLLRELLLAEWELRRRHGQQFQLEPYLARFSASNLPIEELWRVWNEKGSPGVSDDPDRILEAPRDVARLEEPGRVIDRFKLLENIGEGGFGTVWAAEQREPVKRRVALKIIKLGMDTKQVVARFEAERQALAFMDHPNIAKVFDAGTTQSGRPYFVMELVRGIPITTYCQQERLSTKERLDLFMKVCHAIQHAHQKAIIHRDIKPSNILVTLHDGVPVPKVIDFGVAKATQQELTEKTIYTQLQQFIGTPAYMSPEQAEMSGLDIDTRSDIYSLGVLLYELLTGLTPFDAKELVESGLDEMRRIIREREPLRPSSRLTKQLETTRRSTSNRSVATHAPRGPHSTIDRDLDWIVMKCLEKDRRRRYDTAVGLATDIKRHLNLEPIEARPPSLTYRLRKTWQRNKTICTAAAAVLLALAVGLSLAALGWRQARMQRDEALRARAGEELNRKEAEAQQRQAILAREEMRRQAYAPEIGAAFHALDENNLGRAIELRDHWLPKSGEEDLRGFEWRLLWQLCQSDATNSLPERAGSVTFSPDGKWLAYYSNEEIVIRAWPSRHVVKNIPFPEALLAFSPDSRRFAGAHDGELKVWSTDSWQVVKSVESPEGVRSPVVFSPQGNWLVTGALPKGYRVWNTETWEGGPPFGDQLVRKWVADTSVAFSSDGALLVTAGHPDGRESGNQFQVWDFPSLTPRSNFEQFPGRLSCAAFVSNGKYLLTGTGEGLLLVWNVAEGRIEKRIKAHTEWFWSIAMARDGSTFATASGDRTLVLWDAATYEPLVRLRGHRDAIGSVAMSPDGSTLVSASRDGTMGFWDITKRHAQPELPDCIHVAGFSADSRRLMGAGYRTATLWNLDDGAMTTIPIQDYGKLFEDRGYSNFASASRDVHGTEPLAVFGLTNGRVEVWDTAAMTCVSSWQSGDSDIGAVAFAPNGEFIATGNDNGDVVLWETRSHRQVRRCAPLPAGLWCLAFSPNGRLLAGSGKESSCVGLWEVETGRLLRQRNLENTLAMTVDFSPPDGKLLLTGNVQGPAKIWQVPSLAPWGTLSGRVDWGTFSPDGKTIASCSDDCKLKLWNVATQQEMVSIELPGGGRGVKFSPDGRSLAVGYLLEPKQRIRLWRLKSLEEIDSQQKTLGGRP